jgi:ABC-type glycerol-3-phosphate transport system substrate-binding protein
VKQFVPFLSVILLISLLSGCGGFSLLPEKPVTLHFLYIDGPVDYKSLAAKFQRQHRNITIQLDALAYDEYIYANYQSRLPTSDVIRVPSVWLQADVIQQLMSLDPLLASDSKFPTADLFPGSLEALQLDGKQVAIPAGLEPFVVFYIPKKFADARIQPPGPDWTLDEFIRAAQVINNQNSYKNFTYGFCSGAVSGMDMLLFSYLFGGGLFDSNTWPSRPFLNRPENVAALTWFAGLKDLGILPEVTSMYLLAQTVGAQHCGFWIDSIAHRNYGEAAFGTGQDPAAMLPLPKHLAPFPAVNLEVYAIIAKTSNSQAAWQWLTFLMEQPTAAGRLIPPLKTQVFAPGNPNRIPDDVLAVANHLPENMALIPLTFMDDPAVTQIYQAFFTAQEKVFKSQEDAQSALNEAQHQVEGLIK